MKNVVTNWKESILKKGSFEDAVKNLNMICQYKYTIYDINKIERGKRNLPACINWLMLNDTLQDTLTKYGIVPQRSLSVEEWTDLINELTPPARVEP